MWVPCSLRALSVAGAKRKLTDLLLFLLITKMVKSVTTNAMFHVHCVDRNLPGSKNDSIRV